MNSPSSKHNNPPDEIDAPHVMRFGNRRVPRWTVYLSLGIGTVISLVLFIGLGASFQPGPQPPLAAIQHSKAFAPAAANHKATDYLINRLKRYGLWKVNPAQEVPRFFIQSYPGDLHALEDIATKKRVFLHSLLPHALFVREEALHKRERLQSILSKIECAPEDINFAPGFADASRCSWSDYLADDEVGFIQKLCRNYRTTTAEGLLERVDAVPISLMLAQGALESSWGSSRFAREGNSVFGMWTWKTKGIVPARRDEGKTHKVKAYENILDAVRAYQLTLNRLDPYDQFRQLRRQTDDSLVLAEGLSLYSERGEDYVKEIKEVILANDLQKFDSCRLSDLDLPEFSSPAIKSTVIAEPDKASL